MMMEKLKRLTDKLWLKGGFPESYLRDDEAEQLCNGGMISSRPILSAMYRNLVCKWLPTGLACSGE